MTSYRITKNDDDYYFQTDSSIIYKISLQIAGQDYFPLEDVQNDIYSFSFRPLVGREAPNDPRVSITIMDFIKKAMDQNKIINYICSDEVKNGVENTDENKLKAMEARQRLFKMWFEKFNLSDNYVLKPYTVGEGTIQEFRMGFVYSKQYPYISEFRENILPIINQLNDDK